MTITDCIASALDEWIATPIVYGTSDCGLAIADIHNAFHGDGRDFGKTWRGRYDSREGYEVLLGKGGVLRAAWRVARKNNWPRIEPSEAVDGDISIITGADDERSFAIRYQGRWLVRASYGFSAFADDDVLRAWSCRKP